MFINSLPTIINKEAGTGLLSTASCVKTCMEKIRSEFMMNLGRFEDELRTNVKVYMHVVSTACY